VVRNAVRHLAVPLDEALRMVSLYPASYLGVEGRLGRVAPGYEASLAILDDDLMVQGVVVAGELIGFD
jgi:N-acetylglucosamine-6-phosphate deacetylase